MVTTRSQRGVQVKAPSNYLLEQLEDPQNSKVKDSYVKGAGGRPRAVKTKVPPVTRAAAPAESRVTKQPKQTKQKKKKTTTTTTTSKKTSIEPTTKKSTNGRTGGRRAPVRSRTAAPAPPIKNETQRSDAPSPSPSQQLKNYSSPAKTPSLPRTKSVSPRVSKKSVRASTVSPTATSHFRYTDARQTGSV